MKPIKKLVLLIAMLIIPGACSKEPGWRLASGIYVLDKETPVETYTDLVSRLPRKAMYVDRWATWCTPCLEEFAYYDSLRGFLEENDIGILYMNSDMDINDSRWFEFIREQKLRGYHMRLTFKLQRDLIDNAIFIPLVPQFMIIDSAGNILDNNAMRPSDGDELKNQLLELLDLQSSGGKTGP